MTSRLIFKAFKTRSLSLTVEATQALESVLAREDDIEGSLKLILDELKDRIDKREGKLESFLINSPSEK